MIDETDEPSPAVVTEDFGPRHFYTIAPDTQPNGSAAAPGPHLVMDYNSGELVARLPGERDGGDVVTRTATWTIAAESVRHGWDVAAHDAADGREVAVARPRRRLRSYDIDVTEGDHFRLKGNVFTHSWDLTGATGRLAHLTSGQAYVSRIHTFDPGPVAAPLSLLLAISLELDRLETTIPLAVGRWGNRQ